MSVFAGLDDEARNVGVGGMGGRTSGNSSQSDMLSAGKMMVLAPARRAATVFSRRPPIRRTLPVTVSSPVMAIVGSSGLSSARDRSEVAMVMPAEGPASWDDQCGEILDGG